MYMCVRIVAIYYREAGCHSDPVCADPTQRTLTSIPAEICGTPNAMIAIGVAQKNLLRMSGPDQSSVMDVRAGCPCRDPCFYPR